jgi:hypothetical protein
MPCQIRKEVLHKNMPIYPQGTFSTAQAITPQKPSKPQQLLKSIRRVFLCSPGCSYTCYVNQASLKPEILLPRPPEFWDYHHIYVLSPILLTKLVTEQEGLLSQVFTTSTSPHIQICPKEREGQTDRNNPPSHPSLTDSHRPLLALYYLLLHTM